MYSGGFYDKRCANCGLLSVTHVCQIKLTRQIAPLNRFLRIYPTSHIAGESKMGWCQRQWQFNGIGKSRCQYRICTVSGSLEL